MSNIQSIDRAFNILEIISEYELGLSIKEISEKTELHKSTVHRMLQTLVRNNYIMQDGITKNYILTFKMYNIGKRKIKDLDIIRISRPYIEELSKIINETVHLVIRDGVNVVYIDKVESDNTINMTSRVGRRSPAYCTSVGKAMLAWESKDIVEEIWSKSDIKKYTENTIVDYGKFEEEIKLIKKQGYALDNEENENGVMCIGAPIFGDDGNVEAAISVSGPLYRMLEKGIDEIKLSLLKASRDINEQMGYYDEI